MKKLVRHEVRDGDAVALAGVSASMSWAQLRRSFHQFLALFLFHGR